MFSVPSVTYVEEVMDRNFDTLLDTDLIGYAFDKMISSDVRAMLVKNENGEYVGILSLKNIQRQGKVYRRLQDISNMIKVKDVMISDIIKTHIGVTLRDCRNSMIENDVGMLPVENDNGDIVGIIDKDHLRDHYYMKREDYATTLEHIMGEINEGISAIDVNGVVILWNKFMQERYSISSEEIVGKKMSDFLEDTISERVLRTRISKSDIYYLHQKNGKDLYGLVHANPIYYRGEFVGVVCTEIDVTEAQNLSKELEKTNERIKYLQDEVKFLSKGVFDNILGKSYKIEKVKNMAKQVAKTNSSIFIWGESGTGKEVFARAIHEYSERTGQFVPVNCSAIPSELFESEFFGYEEGAFTGARKKGKPGFFEIAKGGTLFLDEIADMPLSMQAKLLRAIQDREIRRVGGEDVISVDVRIISATNKDLEQMVNEELFREDLYYRLNVVELRIPPLRERREDIGILIYSFLDEQRKENDKPFLKLSKDAFRALEEYNWKGNVRELKNTIENIVVLATSNVIEYDELPSIIREGVESRNKKEEYPLDINEAIKKLEVKNITQALKMSGGNKAKAAKILNIPRTTLYYKLDQYNIE